MFLYSCVFFSCTTKINPGSEVFYMASVNLKNEDIGLGGED